MNQAVCLLIISSMVIAWLPWHSVNMPGHTVIQDYLEDLFII